CFQGVLLAKERGLSRPSVHRAWLLGHCNVRLVAEGAINPRLNPAARDQEHSKLISVKKAEDPITLALFNLSRVVQDLSRFLHFLRLFSDLKEVSVDLR